jgi:SAM-dependent methyltransferase
MNNFEKEYYESDRFWAGEAVQDEGNMNRFRETASMIPEDVTSLTDIGCGNGIFVNYLQKESSELNLLAIDRSKAALRFVKTEKKEGDIADIPLADQSYDCVTCLEVIEHLPVEIYRKALSELTRVSRKYVIISVPYAENLEKNHTQCPNCKSIFNADLHLRNFSDETIRHLLDENNFECVLTKKTGEHVFFKGHDRFTRMFYPEHFRVWRSPICPICGYKTEHIPMLETVTDQTGNTASTSHRSLISYFTVFPKLVWPKEKKYYWIVGLYKRK